MLGPYLRDNNYYRLFWLWRYSYQLIPNQADGNHFALQHKISHSWYYYSYPQLTFMGRMLIVFGTLFAMFHLSCSRLQQMVDKTG